jgi:UDP-N-acetylmuramoyl-L-alanyl-D-glutamate--2,6-diaminopimelate ligase
VTGSSLRELTSLEGVSHVEGDADVQVRRVVSDSRAITHGDLFAAIAGATSDGARFAPEAVRCGATAVLAQRELGLSVPTLVVDDVRKRLGPVSHRVFGEPSREMPVVGITGTNGKTTVTHLIESVLSHVGARPAVLGTVAMRGPAGEVGSQLTTPEADVVARFMREQRDAGATHLAMEVSSHALSIDRVLGTRFEVAGLTNLTQDHLDFHGTMEAYGEAKARLFIDYAPRVSVIVVDHPFGEALTRRVRGELLRCSVNGDREAELRVSKWASTRAGIRARVQTPDGELQLESPLFGAHNLENLLVCVGSCLALGIDRQGIAEALLMARGAPGRMERVLDPRDVMILVDYAHTPDALERALLALRPLTSGRLFVVAGCGGDRDRKKRAPMAEAAARVADIAVLTSDNPRTEDPLAILRDMEPGAQHVSTPISADELPHAGRGYTVIADRREAIARAISAARPGDTVLLAGKGHETYQIVGTTKHAFDDRVEAARAVQALAGEG